MVQVWARDANLVRQGIIPVHELTCVLRKSGVGTWVMAVDERAQWAPPVGEGWGVLVFDDGKLLFSGDATRIKTEQSGAVAEVEFAGETDMRVLRDRTVYPDPVNPPSAQTVAYRAGKGPAEDLVAALINENAGPAARVERRTRGLASVVSAGRGAVTSVNARFTSLLEEVRALATVGGLVVDVTDDKGVLKVGVRVPVDNSRAVRLKLQSGINGYTTETTAPTVTSVLVAGQGEGTARVIAEYTDSTGWGGRRVESFQDRRDTSDPDDLAKAGAETLAEGAASASASFELTETPEFRFGEHFNLGDTITVDLPNGVQVSNAVQYAEITWDEYGRSVKLTVGPDSTDEPGTPAAIKQNRALQHRLRGLETRR